MAHHRSVSRRARRPPSAASPAIRRRSTSAALAAVFGRLPTPASRGCRSSTASPSHRSARLRWRLPIPTSSTRAPARPTSVSADRLRRRRLQIHRRRQDVDATSVSRHAADRAAFGGSAQSRPGLRRRARPRLTGRTPSAGSSGPRWRPDLDASAGQRPGTGAVDLALDPPIRTIFATVWNAPPGVEPVRSASKARAAAFSIDRWRRSLDAAHRPRPARIAVGPHRRCGRAGDGRRVYALIDAARAGGLYRSDDGGATGRASTAIPASPAATGTSAGSRSIRKTRTSSTCRTRAVPIHRWRHDVHRRSRARRAATTIRISGSTRRRRAA